jgi:hypothetical protein
VLLLIFFFLMASCSFNYLVDRYNNRNIEPSIKILGSCATSKLPTSTCISPSTKSGTNSSPIKYRGHLHKDHLSSQYNANWRARSSWAFHSGIKGTFTAALKAHSQVCIETSIFLPKGKMQGTHNFLTQI